MKHKVHFFGYSYGKKHWHLYDIETGDIFISREVILHEDIYPVANKKQAENNVLRNLEQNMGWLLNGYDDEFEVRNGLAVSKSRNNSKKTDLAKGSS